MKYNSLSQALTLTVTNHYTMNSFGRPCTHAILPNVHYPLILSQEFNHEFNHLRYTLHLLSTIITYRLEQVKLIKCALTGENHMVEHG